MAVFSQAMKASGDAPDNVRGTDRESLTRLAMPAVQKLQPYTPGEDPELAAQRLKLGSVIKLASNENPLGPGRLAREALASLPDMGRYPDSNASLLRAALAEQLEVQQEQLVFGNGSNDILEIAVRTFAGPGRSVLFPEHSFLVFALAAQTAGAAIDTVAVGKDFKVDYQALLQAVHADTSMLLLANPNNPTGAWLAAEELQQLLQQMPQHVVVVLDEAYAEYMVSTKEYSSAIKWCEQFPNLIVSRTFSKIHGLAGLRTGYAVARPELADFMNRVRQPFNNNSAALLAARAALADYAHISASLELNERGRQQWLQAAAELHLSVTPAAANFVCLRSPLPGRVLARRLELEGVLVRVIDNYGMPDYVRVNFGLEQENEQAIAAMRRVLSGDT